eukprot:242315_1
MGIVFIFMRSRCHFICCFTYTLSSVFDSERCIGYNTATIDLSDDDIQLAVNSMNMVWIKYDSFKLFMDHLVSEFCAENALFLVELVQIKHDYQKRNNFRVIVSKSRDGKSDELLEIDFDLDPLTGAPYTSEQDRYFTYLFNETGSIRTRISIPIQIPQSYIVSQHKNDLCGQMLSLYRKYIDQLNIPYSIHQSLDECFGSESYASSAEETLFNAMDECAAEILTLLEGSYVRFISTDSFGSILEAIKMESENNKLLSNVQIMKQLLNSEGMFIRKVSEEINTALHISQ